MGYTDNLERRWQQHLE
ncbi:MAG: hypothetical protein LBH96_02985 [Candidatus Peribacteria bacterium]|nr:hypothetical protein [Candidatus Peribacteria bacterium]